uniref:Uncharacterized protein n=1 Tax=Panagrolaimus sp. JU765 TaxID=591449 RepID=A0AC34QTT6_9BILA
MKSTVKRPSNSNGFQTKFLEDLKIQENEKIMYLKRLSDMDNIKKQNNHTLPKISPFGTKYLNQNWIKQLCIGQDKRRCSTKFLNLEAILRAAPKYKTLSCLIQKNMSTILEAIMCFLFDEKKFREAKRVLARENRDIRFCPYKNKFSSMMAAQRSLNLSDDETNNWIYLAIVRDPIDRFLSGYVDKCIRKPYKVGYCNGCDGNMTCFILTEYERLMNSSYGKWVTRTFEDRHFFPQTWRCNFKTALSRYKLIHYSSQIQHRSEFLGELLTALESHHVPKDSLKFIKEQLQEGQTIHTTITSEARIFYENILRSSPFLMEHVIRMFYWDYKLLGFDLPKIDSFGIFL